MMSGIDKNSLDKNSQSPPKVVVCVGTIVLKDNAVLFVRQAKGHSLEGQWSIPWGFVDDQEVPEEAALRETVEESGIQAGVLGLLGFQNLHRSGWIGIVFLCQHIAGKPEADGIETDRASYLSLEELSKFEEPIELWCAWMARRVLEGNYTLIPVASDNPYHPKRAFL
jgi:ADP-ribose pyrophosphatase YjhB (NUDIX family)